MQLNYNFNEKNYKYSSDAQLVNLLENRYGDIDEGVTFWLNEYCQAIVRDLENDRKIESVLNGYFHLYYPSVKIRFDVTSVSVRLVPIVHIGDDEDCCYGNYYVDLEVDMAYRKGDEEKSARRIISLYLGEGDIFADNYYLDKCRRNRDFVVGEGEEYGDFQKMLVNIVVKALNRYMTNEWIMSRPKYEYYLARVCEKVKEACEKRKEIAGLKKQIKQAEENFKENYDLEIEMVNDDHLYDWRKRKEDDLPF